MVGWKFFVDQKPWLGDTDLYVSFTDYQRNQKVLAPAVFATTKEPISKEDHPPFLGQTREAMEDGLGDVTNFLQAALDCA